MGLRVFLITLFFFLASARAVPAWLRETPYEYHELVSALVDARQTGVSVYERGELLRVAVEEYKKLLVRHTGLSEMELQAKFQNDAAFRNGLLSPSHPYRELFSEINHLASVLISDSFFKACEKRFGKTSAEERESLRNIMDQRSRYQPSCEGPGYTTAIQVLKKTGFDPETKKDIYAAYPLIFSDGNAAEILALSDLAVRETEFDSEAVVLGRKLPVFEKRPLQKQTLETFKELRRTEELKGEIYEHAVVNSLKTRASVDYRYGGKSLGEIRKDLESRIEGACRHCAPEERRSVLNRVMTSLTHDANLPTGKPYLDRRNIVVDLCNRLIDRGYYDYYPKNVPMKAEDGKLSVGPKRRERLEEYFPNEVVVTGKAKGKAKKKKSKYDIGDLTMYLPSKRPQGESPISMGAQEAAADYSRYHKKRMAIYRSVVREGGTNLLFMTEALSRKSTEKSDDGEEIFYPNLSCTKDGIDEDAEKIGAAIEEAKGETEKVLTDLHETLAPADFSDEQALEKNKKAITEMVAMNPTAVGQAVAERPNLTGYVCDGLNENILATRRKAGMKKLYTWGVVVVGTGLTLTGIGAPVGVQLLLAGGTLAATAGGIYLQDRAATQAKTLSEAYETQYRGGQSENDFLLGLSAEQRREYDELKVSAMDVFGAGIDGFGFVGAGMKAFHSTVAFSRVLQAAKKSKTFKQFAQGKKPIDALTEFAKTEKSVASSVRANTFGVGIETPYKSATEAKKILGFDLKEGEAFREAEFEKIGIPVKKEFAQIDNSPRFTGVLEVQMDRVHDSKNLLMREIQKLRRELAEAGEDADQVRVLISLDEDVRLGSRGAYSPGRNTLIFGKDSFVEYLQTGKIPEVMSHELRHYRALRRKVGDSKFRSAFEDDGNGGGTGVQGYARGFSGHETYAMRKSVWGWSKKKLQTAEKRLSEMAPDQNLSTKDRMFLLEQLDAGSKTPSHVLADMDEVYGAAEKAFLEKSGDLNHLRQKVIGGRYHLEFPVGSKNVKGVFLCDACEAMSFKRAMETSEEVATRLGIPVTKEVKKLGSDIFWEGNPGDFLKTNSDPQMVRLVEELRKIRSERLAAIREEVLGQIRDLRTFTKDAPESLALISEKKQKLSDALSATSTEFKAGDALRQLKALKKEYATFSGDANRGERAVLNAKSKAAEDATRGADGKLPAGGGSEFGGTAYLKLSEESRVSLEKVYEDLLGTYPKKSEAIPAWKARAEDRIRLEAEKGGATQKEADMISGSMIRNAKKKVFASRVRAPAQKPKYTNPGHHDASSSSFRGGGSKTTPLPKDAEEVFRGAIPDPDGRTWWGISCRTGEFYRYQPNAKGSAEVHWNGMTGKGVRSLRLEYIPNSVKNVLTQSCR